MKPRARRVTITAAVLGAAVVAVLVSVHWGTVRDHVEAWHFQLTRETVTIEPESASPLSGNLSHEALTNFLLLASVRLPIVFDPVEVPLTGGNRAMLPNMVTMRAGEIVRLLEADGWRVLEQRFPRRAYVVIRHHPGVLTTSSEGEDAGITLEITPTVRPTVPAGCEQEAAPAE